MAKKSYDILFKLLLIGDSGVGKTCLLFRYSDDTFSPTFISTIGIDFKIKTIDFNGKKIKLQIWDTAGQERFHTITVSYYRGAQGIMLVYDVTNRKSFDNINTWVSKIQNHASESVEKIIVANKMDMEDKRVISRQDGELLAKANCLPFIEASAKTGDNVSQAFELLTQSILKSSSHRAPAGNGTPNVVDPSQKSEEKDRKCC